MCNFPVLKLLKNFKPQCKKCVVLCLYLFFLVFVKELLLLPWQLDSVQCPRKCLLSLS